MPDVPNIRTNQPITSVSQHVPAGTQAGELRGKRVTDLTREIKEFKTNNPITLLQRIIAWIKVAIASKSISHSMTSRFEVLSAINNKFVNLNKLINEINEEQTGLPHADRENIKEGVLELRNIMNDLKGVRGWGVSDATRTGIQNLEKSIQKFEKTVDKAALTKEERAKRREDLFSDLVAGSEAGTMKAKEKEIFESDTTKVGKSNEELFQEPRNKATAYLIPKKPRKKEIEEPNTEKTIVQKNETISVSKTSEEVAARKGRFGKSMEMLVAKFDSDEKLKKSLGKHPWLRTLRGALSGAGKGYEAADHAAIKLLKDKNYEKADKETIQEAFKKVTETIAKGFNQMNEPISADYQVLINEMKRDIDAIS